MNVRLHVALLLGAACAANEPAGVEFDHSAGLVVVEVGDDGFVRCDGRRAPWEAVVLELRQRTRTMSADELQRFVVHLRADAHPEASEAAARTTRTRNRVLDELYIMGVRQVKCL
ncbi:MAG: hypothetical protein JNM25_13955 [Planctomycetes bacterium]|nr:hypothetical protein [Planctomycetota bacterium]